MSCKEKWDGAPYHVRVGADQSATYPCVVSSSGCILAAVMDAGNPDLFSAAPELYNALADILDASRGTLAVDLDGKARRALSKARGMAL